LGSTHCKISPIEVAPSKRLKRDVISISNKLTSGNFDSSLEQFLHLPINDQDELRIVTEELIEKALSEPKFSHTYAKFVIEVDKAPKVDNDRRTFRKFLLQCLQNEFEKTEFKSDKKTEDKVGASNTNNSAASGQAENIEKQPGAADLDNAADSDSELTPEEKESKRMKSKQRRFGIVRFLGELYLGSSLANTSLIESIIETLLDSNSEKYAAIDELDIEELCRLITTVGEKLCVRPRGAEMVDETLARMVKLVEQHKITQSRVRLLIQDTVDLKQRGWAERPQLTISEDCNGEVKATATGSSADPTDAKKSAIANSYDDSDEDDDTADDRIHIVVPPLQLFLGRSSERCTFVTRTDIYVLTSAVREILDKEPVFK